MTYLRFTSLVLIFAAFFCNRIRAQFSIAEQPMFQSPSASTSPTPSSISNLFRWWVSSDVPVNVTVSNQWSDRIVGESMAQMNTAVSPTNSVSGIRFNGSQYVTNASGSGYSVGNITADGQGDTLFWLYVPAGTAGNNGIFSHPSEPYGPNQDGANLTYGGLNSGGPNPITSVTAGTTNDVILSIVKSNSTTWRNIWYLNGVSVKTNTTGGIDGFVFKSMGRSSLGFFSGYILEAGIYTNILWDQNLASTIHAYMTNTYPYSP